MNKEGGFRKAALRTGASARTDELFIPFQQNLFCIVSCDKLKLQNRRDHMTIKEMADLVGWVKNNSRRKLTEEEKAWAKREIDKAETIRDLAKAVLGFMRSGT